MIVTAAANIMILIATASSFQPCEQTRRCHDALTRRVQALAPRELDQQVVEHHS
jgi:hypothetical protein